MKKRTSSSSIEYPPGPHSILPNKLLREFIHNPIKMLLDIAYTYGDICHFKFVRQHVYLTNNPYYIEDILIRNYRDSIKSRGLQVSKRLWGEGSGIKSEQADQIGDALLTCAEYFNRLLMPFGELTDIYHTLKPLETFGIPISEPDCLSLMMYVVLCGTH